MSDAPCLSYKGFKGLNPFLKMNPPLMESYENQIILLIYVFFIFLFKLGIKYSHQRSDEKSHIAVLGLAETQ